MFYGRRCVREIERRVTKKRWRDTSFNFTESIISRPSIPWQRPAGRAWPKFWNTLKPSNERGYIFLRWSARHNGQKQWLAWRKKETWDIASRAELGTKISARDAKSFHGTSLHRNRRDGRWRMYFFLRFCHFIPIRRNQTTANRPLLRLCSLGAPIVACQSSKK